MEPGNHKPVDSLRQGQFPRRKRRHRGRRVQRCRQEGVVAPSQRTGEQGVRGRHVLRYRGSVQPQESQHRRQHALRKPDARGPDGDVIVLHAGHLGGLRQRQHGGGDHLEDLLEHDVAGDFPARSEVALGDLLGRVQAVLREDVVDVDEVEEERDGPVGDVRGDDGEPEVGDDAWEEVGHGRDGVGWEWRQLVCHCDVEGGAGDARGRHGDGGRVGDHDGPSNRESWLEMDCVQLVLSAQALSINLTVSPFWVRVRGEARRSDTQGRVSGEDRYVSSRTVELWEMSRRLPNQGARWHSVTPKTQLWDGCVNTEKCL